MEKAITSDFKFDRYLIRYSEQEINVEKLDNSDLSIVIKPSGKRYTEKFVLTLDVQIKDESEEFKLHFIIDGHFSFKDGLEKKTLSPYFLLNAPAILFPYIRGYVAMSTSLSGIGTINLPLLNLSGLKPELEQNIAQIEE